MSENDIRNIESDFVEFLDHILNNVDEEEWETLLQAKKEQLEGKGRK